MCMGVLPVVLETKDVTKTNLTRLAILCVDPGNKLRTRAANAVSLAFIYTSFPVLGFGL